MAYIKSEEVKEIRNELKSLFPNLKLSVTREHHSVLNVAIMEGNIAFEKEYEQVNHYNLDNKKHKLILKLINHVSNRKNFDKSDSMTDYFHVGYYFHLRIGKWDKGYVCKSSKN